MRTVCLRHNIDNNFQLILIIYIKTPLQYSRCKICSLHNQQNLKCVTTTTIFSNARNETQVWSLQHQTTKMATLACSLTLIFKVIIYERNWSYILSYYVPSFQVSYAERNKFLVQIFHTMCYYTSSEWVKRVKLANWIFRRNELTYGKFISDLHVIMKLKSMHQLCYVYVCVEKDFAYTALKCSRFKQYSDFIFIGRWFIYIELPTLP